MAPILLLLLLLAPEIEEKDTTPADATQLNSTRLMPIS